MSEKTNQPTSDPLRKTGIYSRLTSEESRKKGLSSKAQRNEGHEYAKKAGLSPVEVFEEPIGVGGDRPFSERPAAASLIAQVKRGLISDIIVRDVDRITRDVLLWLELSRLCEEHNTRIHTFGGPLPTSTPSDRLTSTLRAAVAQHEREQIADRIRRSKRQLAIMGKYVGGPLPFGFTTQARCRRELIESGMSEHEARLKAEAKYKHAGCISIDKAEAKIVRLIFRLYVEKRLGCRQICNELNRRGHRRRSGRLWNADKVRTRINDPTVAGFIPFDEARYERGNGPRTPKCDQTLYPGQHEAIIDEATWRKAQEIKKQNTCQTAKRGKADVSNRRNALTGVLQCLCGSRMKAVRQHGKYGYYCCRKRFYYGSGARGGCDAPRIAISKADEAFWGTISQTVSSSEFVDRVHAAVQELLADQDQDAEPDPEVELRKVHGDLDAWYARHDAADTDVEKEASWRRIVELTQRRKDLQVIVASKQTPENEIEEISYEQVEHWLTNLVQAVPKSKDQGKLLVQLLAEQHSLVVKLVDSETLQISLAFQPPGSNQQAETNYAVNVETQATLPKGKIDSWLDQNQGTCVCGICGEDIPVLRRHYWRGLPEFHPRCWASQLSKRRTNPDPERFYNGQQAANRLSISRTQLGNWIKRGKITPSERRNNLLLFDREVIDHLAKQLEKK